MCRQATFHRTCAECGTAFTSTRKHAEFCSTACRLADGNRRRLRGAMLLDLYVHQRFNRAKAEERNLRTLIDRMVGNWVEEDRMAGRRAMRPLQDCIQAALPHTAFRAAVRAGK